MNRIRFVCLLFCILFFSCNNENNIRKKIENIKCIGDSNPELAMKMLDSLKKQDIESNVYLENKCALLDIRLRDKLYIQPLSDRSIKKLLKYFVAKGTQKDKQEVYFYAGSVYRDLQDTPRALENFFNSVNVFNENPGCDSVMQQKAYGNLNALFYDVQDYKNALLMAEKECGIAQKMNNLKSYSVIHVGIAQIHVNDTLAAIKSFERALAMAQNESGRVKMEAYYPLLCYFSFLKMEKQAKLCYHQIAENHIKPQTIDNMLALAQFYLLLGKRDSTIKWCNEVLNDSANYFGAYDATRILFDVYSVQGNWKLANIYAKKFIKVSDTLNLGERQRLAATTNNMYQYHRDMKEEQKIMQKQEHMKIWMVVLITFFLSLFFLLTIFYFQKKNAQLKKMLALSSQLKDKDKELEVNKKALEENERQKQDLIRTSNQIKLEESAEEIIQKIQLTSEGKYNMQPKDWRQLYAAIDELYPDFCEEIYQKLGKCKKTDKQIVYLLKIGLSNRQIENITDVSHVTVWRNVNKIKNAFGW